MYKKISLILIFTVSLMAGQFTNEIISTQEQMKKNNDTYTFSFVTRPPNSLDKKLFFTYTDEAFLQLIKDDFLIAKEIINQKNANKTTLLIDLIDTKFFVNIYINEKDKLEIIYNHIDKIVELFKKYNVKLSLEQLTDLELTLHYLPEQYRKLPKWIEVQYRQINDDYIHNVPIYLDLKEYVLLNVEYKHKYHKGFTKLFDFISTLEVNRSGSVRELMLYLIKIKDDKDLEKKFFNKFVKVFRIDSTKLKLESSDFSKFLKTQNMFKNKCKTTKYKIFNAIDKSQGVYIEGGGWLYYDVNMKNKEVGGMKGSFYPTVNPKRIIYDTNISAIIIQNPKYDKYKEKKDKNYTIKKYLKYIAYDKNPLEIDKPDAKYKAIYKSTYKKKEYDSWDLRGFEYNIIDQDTNKTMAKSSYFAIDKWYELCGKDFASAKANKDDSRNVSMEHFVLEVLK